VNAVRASGHAAVTYVERKEILPDQVVPALKPGDLVLTLGAGDIWKAGLGVLDRLPA
jgi:UDP-N-acetylmuramate--alanine ligase